MKKIVLVLTILSLLVSCSGTCKISKRETIPPEAPLNMPFRSDITTIRAYNAFSDTNPVNSLNSNIAYCKALIAASAFNGIEDACTELVDNYPIKKKFIENVSDEIIRNNIDDAVVVYTKTYVADDGKYTSVIVVELEKKKMLDRLKELFTENGVTETAEADALIRAIDESILKNAPKITNGYL